MASERPKTKLGFAQAIIQNFGITKAVPEGMSPEQARALLAARLVHWLKDEYVAEELPDGC